MEFWAGRFSEGALEGSLPGGVVAAGSRRARRRRGQRSLGPKLEQLESRTVLSQVTWTGSDAATSTKWSDANNWLNDTAPVATDDLSFPPVTNSALTSTNDLTAGTSFASLTVSGSGYTISGNGIALTGLLQASQTSGSSTVNLPVDFGTAQGMVQVTDAGSILVLEASSAARVDSSSRVRVSSTCRPPTPIPGPRRSAPGPCTSMGRLPGWSRSARARRSAGSGRSARSPPAARPSIRVIRRRAP